MFFIIVTRREDLLTILWFSQYVKLLSIDKIFKMGLKFENYDNLPALFCLSSILLIERWLGTGRDVRKKLLKMKIQNHKMLTSCPGSQGDITRPVQLYRLENCKIPSWKKKRPESYLVWKCILAPPWQPTRIAEQQSPPTWTDLVFCPRDKAGFVLIIRKMSVISEYFNRSKTWEIWRIIT